jgi:hypothetical protein
MTNAMIDIKNIAASACSVSAECQSCLKKGQCTLQAPVASPCIGVCRIDAQSGWCTGCFRTLDEIGAWSKLDEADQRDVLVRVAWRRMTGSEA